MSHDTSGARGASLPPSHAPPAHAPHSSVYLRRCSAPVVRAAGSRPAQVSPRRTPPSPRRHEAAPRPHGGCGSAHRWVERALRVLCFSGPRTEPLSGLRVYFKHMRPPHLPFLTRCFSFSAAENLALPVGREGQREETVCLDLISLINFQSGCLKIQKCQKMFKPSGCLFTADDQMFGGSPF